MVVDFLNILPNLDQLLQFREDLDKQLAYQWLHQPGIPFFLDLHGLRPHRCRLARHRSVSHIYVLTFPEIFVLNW
jgi:hypothetical protein